jgi:hypothetical protein
MSVALSIAFTGLCALVTDGDRGPAQMLLVDARGIGELRGVVLPEHAPTLVVNLGSLANAATSYPDRVVVAAPAGGSTGMDAHAGRGSATEASQIGLWDLSGSEVRVRVQAREAAGLAVYRPAQGASSWPEAPSRHNDPGAWRDIRFVADMTSLTSDGRINPALVAHDGETAHSLPRGVAARVLLDGGRLEAGMPSHEAFRDEVFEFRGARGEPRLRQALTDTIRWTSDTDVGVVVVEIVPVAGGSSRRLVFAPSSFAHDVFVSNLPAANVLSDAHHANAMSDDEMAALHFGAYYKLLANEPADQPLPRVSLSPSRKGAGLAGTTLCPPVWFNR